MIHLAHDAQPRLSTHVTTSGNPGRRGQIGGVATVPQHQVATFPQHHVMSGLAVAPHRVTILLVDDESWIRDLILGMLTYVGYSVLEASSAQQAMVTAERHSSEIDLLVTDVVLPDMDGFDLAYCLSGSMRVLFVTGHAEDDALVRTRLRGTSFLLKPFRVEELQRSIHRALNLGPLAA